MGAGGKCRLVFVLVVFVLDFRSRVCAAESEISGGELLLDRQKVEIRKLEELVMNLSEIVGRLEAKLLPVVEKVERFEDGDVDGLLGLEDVNVRIEVERVGKGERRTGKRAIRELDKVGIDGEREKRAFSVKKYSPFWSEKFQFEAAVKLDSEATCVNVLPFKDSEGLSKYFAVGDEKGRIYVFLRNGDVSFEFDTTSHSPILSMVSYLSVYKNESVVVTGHGNGEIKMHRVWEASSGEDWSSLMMEFVRDIDGSVNGYDDGSVAVTILEVHHVGRMRYILSVGGSGTINVYRENGMLYGSVVPSSKPIVFLKQRLLFLTETGAGSLDLRTLKVKESECEGLNRSRVRNYVFDAAERSKAYGFTSEAEMIHVLLLGDVMNFKCRVRSKRKFEMEEPVVLQAIKGYLLVVNQEKVFVYNVSSQHYVRAGSPRLLFSAGIDEIRATFLNNQATGLDSAAKVMIPLVASDKDKLVVFGLGGGYVGLYRSNLPIFRSESSTILWTSPVLFFGVFLFAAWHFFAKKKEVLTAWGPDDPSLHPFTSTSVLAGATLGSSPDERPFTDSTTRNSDLMDLRSGSGLRGPSRRYASPSRYSGGSANSFKPGSADLNSRPASADPSFRNSAELKYRGSALDSGGFSKRRESIFANSQVDKDVN